MSLSYNQWPQNVMSYFSPLLMRAEKALSLGGVGGGVEEWSFSLRTDSQRLPPPISATTHTVTESYSQVVVMATKRQPTAGGSYHPTSGASSLPSHHSSHLTNCVIKRPQIVINYKVCLHDSKFGHARITLRIRKSQL